MRYAVVVGLVVMGALFAGQGSTHAQTAERKLLFILVFAAAVCSGFAGRANAQVQPNGIPAPAGYKWVVSYDEEFTRRVLLTPYGLV